MKDGEQQRRCTDCPEHSGVTAELEAGRGVMGRLEKGFEELRTDFNDHVTSSFKGTIAILISLLLIFITGVVGIYVNSRSPKDQYSSQAEMTMMVKAMASAIKEAKK